MISKTYNRDCVEAMKEYPDKHFDLAVVDPPYGLGDKLTNGGTWSVKWQAKGADWDKVPTKEYWEQLFRISKNWICFGGNYFIEYLPNCRNFIAWHKPYMDGMGSMSNVELALTSFDRNAKNINKQRQGKREQDTFNSKPVALYDWIFQNYAKEGDLILDTHLGSQSSRIAAHKNNLDFIGYEIDADYFNEGNKRYELFASQLTLF